MITRGGYSNDYEGRVQGEGIMITGEGTIMITRGGYYNDYKGRVL